jgi:hypothetical protein
VLEEKLNTPVEKELSDKINSALAKIYLKSDKTQTTEIDIKEAIPLIQENKEALGLTEELTQKDLADCFKDIDLNGGKKIQKEDMKVILQKYLLLKRTVLTAKAIGQGQAESKPPAAVVETKEEKKVDLT